jgi:hypothetical protein
MLLVPVSGGCSEPEDENTFIKLLRLLPATAKEDRVIVLIDHEKWRQVNGISVYDEDGQRINCEEYLDNIAAAIKEDSIFGSEIWGFGTYWTSGLNKMLVSPIQNDTIGYEYSDIDAEINNSYMLSGSSGIMKPVVESAYPEGMITAIGDYDEHATNAALMNRDDWPSKLKEIYTSENYRDITIHSWGDSHEMSLNDRLSSPHVDNIGRAYPVAVTDGQLFVGTDVDDIKSMIDTRMKKTDSLADLPGYALTARGMYDLGAIGALIMEEEHTRDVLKGYSPLTGPQIIKFLTVGMGPGKDETGEYFALVLVYENQTDAEEGVSLLKEKIEEHNERCNNNPPDRDKLLKNTEVRTENRVLLAKLYTTDTTLWKYWFFQPWTTDDLFEFIKRFNESMEKMIES